MDQNTIQARFRLERMRQKNRSFAAYFDEFSRVAGVARMDDSTLYTRLIDGLSSRELRIAASNFPEPPNRDWRVLGEHLKRCESAACARR